MGLMTMTDLTFTVRVAHWTWTYTFSRKGSVTWRDPYNGKHGNGSWRVNGTELIVSWPSGSWDSWDLPINPKSASGRAFVEGEGEYDLWAEAHNYYLRPGDVVTVGQTKYVIYEDEV